MNADQMPKAPRKNAAEIKHTHRPETFTLKRLLTSNDTKPFYISFLREQANKKGPWNEYYEFYRANMSGDVESMSSETRKYVEKMYKDIQEKYSEVIE